MIRFFFLHSHIHQILLKHTYNSNQALVNKQQNHIQYHIFALKTNIIKKQKRRGMIEERISQQDIYHFN